MINQSEAKLMKTIICTHCDLVSEQQIVPKGYVAKCSRCNHAFIKADTVKPIKILALAITALIIMLPAYTFPLISVHLLGVTEDSNLLQGALMMIDKAPIVAFVILFCSVVVPTLLTFCFGFSSACMVFNKRPSMLNYVLKLTKSLMHWSMLDVYLLSLLVSIIKITNDADIYFKSGFVFFIVLLIVNLTLISEYSNKKYWKYLRNE